jgi:DNA-directed RNA polymerase subunit RPC12/RpoP
MDFTCVNCSRLTAASFTSDDLTVYRCNNCDIEYRLIVGCVEKQQSAQSVSMGSSKVMNESDGSNVMPIRVKIKRP